MVGAFQVSFSDSSFETDQAVQPRPLLTHERVMIVVLAITLATTCWLISAGRGTEEGHRAWRAGSALRIVTNLMALDFEYPTRRGSEIKWLTAGLGSAAAVLVAGAACYRRTRRRDDDETLLSQQAPFLEAAGAPTTAKLKIGPAGVAQFALVAYTGWMIASAMWARWPEAAFGEAMRQLIFTVWAIAIGRTLSRRSTPAACRVLAGVLVLTAVVGIWYYIERNPFQRLKFPIGNPIFLAACLIPGITLTFGELTGTIRRDGDLNKSPRFRWGLLIASIAGLLILLSAFKLADSRGPQLGLAIGVVAAICLITTGRDRRYLIFALILCCLAGLAYVQYVGLPGFLTRRMDTVLLRGYAWWYAIMLFAAKPLIGQGQGSYMLMAQKLSSPDAIEHPTVFLGNVRGHAHNEWLEILSDLGVVGFILMAIVLIATILCAARMLRRAEKPIEQGRIFGLSAAFVGLIVTEMTDVGLRMPGLPIVFYTVIGLIWSLSREPNQQAVQVTAGKRITGVASLAGTIVLAIVISMLAGRDFQGALAYPKAGALAAQHQWDQALAETEVGQYGRFSVESHLAAAAQYNLIAYQAATHRLDQMRRMLGRLEEPNRPTSRIKTLAQEDRAVFENYAALCLSSGGRLLERMPDYPMVAGRMAEILLMTQQIEIAEQRIGLRQEVRSYLGAARSWLQVEHDRDPYDMWVALQLFRLSKDQTLIDRLNLLRIPLRAGPRPPGGRADEFVVGKDRLILDLFGELEAGLAALLSEADYRQTLEQLLTAANQAMESDPGTAWPDPYVPETYRLAARDRKLTRQFAKAAELAGMAARAAERIVDRFPTAVADALIDQCRYLLLAYPNEPERAVAACREAIERWPTTGDRRRALRLRQSLAAYLLATGQEQVARDAILAEAASLSQSVQPDRLDRIIGHGLGEICAEMAGALPVEQRPAWYADRLARSLELLPDWPETRLLAAFSAFETNRPDEGIAQLEIMEKLVDDPSSLAGALQTLLRAFPQNNQLLDFARVRFPVQATPAATDNGPNDTGMMPARIGENTVLRAPLSEESAQPTTPTTTAP